MALILMSLWQLLFGKYCSSCAGGLISALIERKFYGPQRSMSVKSYTSNQDSFADGAVVRTKSKEV